MRQANARGIPIRSFTVPMHQVDRAILDGEQTGFVKIHVAQRSDKILGATIVARHAGDMINEITVAMVHGIGLQGLAKVIQGYRPRPRPSTRPPTLQQPALDAIHRRHGAPVVARMSAAVHAGLHRIAQARRPCWVDHTAAPFLGSRSNATRATMPPAGLAFQTDGSQWHPGGDARRAMPAGAPVTASGHPGHQNNRRQPWTLE